MQKWDYSFTVSYSTKKMGSPAMSEIWEKKRKKGKRTVWDDVVDMGLEGWEMVNAFPTSYDGDTCQIVFIYKRPLEDYPPPTPVESK